MTEKEFRTGKKDKEKRIALKDHVLCQNEDLFHIAKGDDLDKLKIPDRYNQVLITEKVLKG